MKHLDCGHSGWFNVSEGSENGTMHPGWLNHISCSELFPYILLASQRGMLLCIRQATGLPWTGMVTFSYPTLSGIFQNTIQYVIHVEQTDFLKINSFAHLNFFDRNFA